MTLNANLQGAVRMTPRVKLEGPERGLDALVGLVILIAELFIGLLGIFALYEAGSRAGDPARLDAMQAGFAIALFGGGAVVIITTIIYLGRVIAGRRSWPATLWGTIVMSIALVIGYAVMFA